MLQSVIQKTGIFRWILVLSAVGILLGIVTANVTKPYFSMDQENFDLLFLSNIETLEIDGFLLFWMIVGKRIREYLFIWIFAVTALWVPCSILFLLYQGFLAGFLTAVAVIVYGIKGILLMLAFYLPQALVYLPVFAAAVIRGYEVNRRISSFGFGQNGGRRKLLAGELPVFFLLLAGLLAGCLLEAYVNVWLVKRAVRLF